MPLVPPVCPKDAITELLSVSLEDISMLQCPVCEGHWLYYGDLETLAEHHGEHVQTVAVGTAQAVKGTRHCPIDATLLDVRTFSDHRDIQVDQCPQCRGIWLDHDELENVLAASSVATPEHQPTLGQQAMLFVYALTKHPPFY